MDKEFIATLESAISAVKAQGSGGFYVVVLPTDHRGEYDEGIVSPSTEDDFTVSDVYSFDPNMERAWGIAAIKNIAEKFEIRVDIEMI